MLKSSWIYFARQSPDVIHGDMLKEGDRFVARFHGARTEWRVEELASEGSGVYASYRGLTNEWSDQECLEYLQNWVKRQYERFGRLPSNVSVVDLPDEILARLRIFYDGQCLQCDKCPPEPIPGDYLDDYGEEDLCKCHVPFRKIWSVDCEWNTWLLYTLGENRNHELSYCGA